MLSRAITSLPSIDNLRFVIELVIEELRITETRLMKVVGMKTEKVGG